MKSNYEISQEIRSTCVGAVAYQANLAAFRGETKEFYDVCRKAEDYEEKGWYRRAIDLWNIVFSLNDNAYSQAYAIRNKARCNRALKAIAKSKRDEEETAVPADAMKCGISLGAEW